MSDIRACPVCGEPLTPEQEGAIQLDVCEEHGVWLDNGELDTLTMAATRRTGRRIKRRFRDTLRSQRRAIIRRMWD